MDQFQERWRRTQDQPKVARPKVPRSSMLELAAALRLGVETSSGSKLEASRGEISVKIERGLVARREWRGLVNVPGLPPSMAFSAEGRISRLKKALGGGDVLTGDDVFDEAVLLQGDPVELLAMLDHGNRHLVASLVAGGLELSKGTLILQRRSERDDEPPKKLLEELRTAFTLAKRLAASGRSVEARLAEHAKTDPSLGVRMRCLELLVRRDPERVRALAGPRRSTVLAPALRWQAARLLAMEDADALLDDVPEPGLIALLAHGGVELRPTVIAQLADVGTADAIDALLPIATELLGRSKLKTAARAAIAAIEKRVGDDRGRLSLTAPAGGELSVARDRGARGSLSLAQERGGELSVASSKKNRPGRRR